MDKFIHRENLRLLERRLADPDLIEPQRKVILKLMLEEQEKGTQAMPREVISNDEARAYLATAAAARAAVENVRSGAPEAVTEPAVLALTHVKHTVGKLFDTECRTQQLTENRDGRQRCTREQEA